MLYLDASAFLKLAVREAESTALRRYLAEDDHWFASTLLFTEAMRGAARHGEDRAAVARRLLDRIQLVRLDEEILRSAAQIGPPSLRTLDAVHIATALTLGDELEALVTYDRRMQDAADSLGMAFAAPA